KDVTHDDAARVRAHDSRGLDVEHLADAEDVCAHHAREGEPGRERENPDEVHDARRQDRRDRDGEDEDGDRLLHISDAHDHSIPTMSEISRDEPERDAYAAGHDHADEADGERDSRALDHPKEDVAAEMVGAEEVAVRPPGPRRRIEPLQEELGARRWAKTVRAQ